MFFENIPLIKSDAPQWVVPPPTLKNEATPPLKTKIPFKKIIPGKKTKKSETVIDTCILLIKQQCKKIKIPQKRDLLTWSI